MPPPKKPSKKCLKKCASQAEACRDQADADYQAARASCSSISDPTQQQMCLINAANAYDAAVNACRTSYEFCCKLCADEALR